MYDTSRLDGTDLDGSGWIRRMARWDRRVRFVFSVIYEGEEICFLFRLFEFCSRTSSSSLPPRTMVHGRSRYGSCGRVPYEFVSL